MNFFTHSFQTNEARSFLSIKSDDDEEAEEVTDELTEDVLAGATDEAEEEELAEESDDEEDDDDELSSADVGRSLAISFMYETRLRIIASLPESYVSFRFAYGPNFSLQDGISKSVGRKHVLLK